MCISIDAVIPGLGYIVGASLRILFICHNSLTNANLSKAVNQKECILEHLK